jgi:hypothetical protein
VSRNIDIIFIVIVLFIYAMKTLVTYQVTNDHSLSCLHKLNTSIVQTRLVNVRTTQKWLHNSTCTTLTQQFPPLSFRWTCSIQRHHTRFYCCLNVCNQFISTVYSVYSVHSFLLFFKSIHLNRTTILSFFA